MEVFSTGAPAHAPSGYKPFGDASTDVQVADVRTRQRPSDWSPVPASQLAGASEHELKNGPDGWLDNGPEGRLDDEPDERYDDLRRRLQEEYRRFYG